MLARDLSLQEPLASEVNTTLIEFGRLSRHVGSATFDTLNTLADELLKHLVSLCKAQRGALLLMGTVPDSESASVRNDIVPAQQGSSSNLRFVRALALHALCEEEVSALLAAFPATPTCSAAQITSDMSCWITYRLSIGDIPVETRKLPRTSLEHSQIWLVLGWDGLEDEARSPEGVESPQTYLHLRGTSAGDFAVAMERGCSVLPFVADAAAGVIVSILLAERVHELETAAEQQALHRANSLKAELLGTMNHELRSPLTAIKGYAATLMRHERRLSREERHEFLSAINLASDRLETTIERLLEMSELETGELTMQLATIDLVHLTGEAIAAIQERMVAVGFPAQFTFKLSIEHANGTPARHVPLVSGDLRRLREVLDNLLENAMKYSPKGGTIKVVLRPAIPALVSPPQMALINGNMGGAPLVNAQQQGLADLPAMVEICVCDSGIGIPGEHLERIFDRFHRVDTRLTREVDGLGLGLAICKRIVELHKGRIWAESLPGEGSTFHVLLPVADAEMQ